MTRYTLIVGLVFLLILAVPVLAQDPTPIPGDVASDVVDFTVDTAESTAAGIDRFIERLTTTPQSDITRALFIVGGIILLLAGWRIYEFVIIIAGMLAGAAIAVSLVTTNSDVILLAALLIGGLLGAVVSIFLYHVAVFIIGAYLGIVLTNSIAAMLELTPVSSLALLVGALLGGLVLLGLSFEFLVLLSAIVGAQMLALGLGLDAVWMLIFAVIGIVVQIGLIRTYRYSVRRRRTRRIRPFRRRAVEW